MKNKIQIGSLFLCIIGFVSLSTLKAQTTSGNVIPEIQLSKNDTFNKIRKELINNFDFTNYEYKQGVVNSEVKFDITENGKIVNVHSTGDCKNVSKEIENVLTNLKINRKDFNNNIIAYTYVMPVTVEIDNR
ncbi:hypothetical protein MTQ00_06375 [Chryseobacterium sp. B21-037]|uniref:hypothetical protein n=1 Tax=unclassified Chryseobacterium TaxID=2593645 RepID=UPI002358E086|nr:MULTISPECIES: hypothetical protein [unclassified Chryseobacterium]MDC8104162.1 hypothetical protein [Chryseobacterium sp. B21-037]MDQ1803771.1 hypothetical protein [Chryseobacterium sp. CKR4-1]